MGTNYSGLFKNTKGARDREVKSSAERMHRDVTNWAHNEANRLEKMSKGKRDDFKTACIAYDPKSDSDFFGKNKGALQPGVKRNEIIFGENGLLPKESLNSYPLGNCAEVDAINQALNAGAKLENLYIIVIHSTKKHIGELKPSCKNCTFTFKEYIKENHSGWIL